MQNNDMSEAAEKPTTNQQQPAENDSGTNQEQSPQDDSSANQEHSAQNISRDAPTTETSHRRRTFTGPTAGQGHTREIPNEIFCVKILMPHPVEFQMRQPLFSFPNMQFGAPNREAANRKRPATTSETITSQKAARTATTSTATEAAARPQLDPDNLMRAIPVPQPPGPPRAGRVFLATRPCLTPPMADEHPFISRLLNRQMRGDPNVPPPRVPFRAKYRRILEFLRPLTADIVMHMIQSYNDDFNLQMPLTEVVPPRPVGPSAAVGSPDGAEVNTFNLRRDMVRELFMQMQPNESPDAEVPELPALQEPEQQPDPSPQ